MLHIKLQNSRYLRTLIFVDLIFHYSEFGPSILMYKYEPNKIETFPKIGEKIHFQYS